MDPSPILCCVEPFCLAESHVGLAYGILYGSSKGIGFFDKHSTSIKCDTLWLDVEICDVQVDGALRDGTEGNTSNDLHIFRPHWLTLDGLSFLTLMGMFECGNHWSALTNF